MAWQIKSPHRWGLRLSTCSFGLRSEHDAGEAVGITNCRALDEVDVEVHLSFGPIIVLAEGEGELAVIIRDGFLRATTDADLRSHAGRDH